MDRVWDVADGYFGHQVVPIEFVMKWYPRPRTANGINQIASLLQACKMEAINRVHLRSMQLAAISQETLCHLLNVFTLFKLFKWFNLLSCCSYFRKS